MTEWRKIDGDWSKYSDEIIPEDKAFATRIIKFIMSVIDYAIKNYDDVDIEIYREFLAMYDYYFLYGPDGDDHNYLSFDEKLDGESITEFCWELKDESIELTNERLIGLKAKYARALKLFKD